MTLFSGLYLGASAVNTNQLALRVVGNNIANAGTEGYVREELRVGALPPIRQGSLNIGTGATAISTQQQIDRYLKERSRQSASEFEAAQSASSLYGRLEGILNELTDEDLSTSFSNFFSSIQGVANRPDDPALRSLVIQSASLLTGQLQDTRAKLDGLRTDINNEVKLAGNEINQTLTAIKELNVKIVAGEAGTGGDAGTLRSQRDQELDRLAKLVDIQVYEQPNGSVNVLTDGDYLLFNGSIQKVGFHEEFADGERTTQLVFEGSERALPVTGGRLGGIQNFRDVDLKYAAGQLDFLTQNFLFEFNKIHSSGQGLQDFSFLQGTYRVLDSTAVLDSPDSGLNFVPDNGSFNINVRDQTSGQQQTYTIDVDLDGIGTDDSLDDVIARINTTAFGGVPVASVNAQGKLQFNAPAGQEFSFSNDTSGFLAALGVNTFFTGNNARDIQINGEVAGNPALFAASSNGLPGDNSNALALVNFQEQSIDALGSTSVNEFFNSIVTGVGAGSQGIARVASVLETTKLALEAENLAITGVSLDEEAVKLITFQRAFQASAQYIRTINELLDEVIAIGR